MTLAAARPRPVDPDRRRALRAMVQHAIDSLVAPDPAAPGKPAHVLAVARGAAEEGDGCAGRASAGIRTAWAYLASGQVEEAFFALECARDALTTA